MARSLFRVLFVTAALSLLSPSPRAALAGPSTSDPQTLAGELSRLRGEVETLSAELAQSREDLRGRLRARAAEQAELEHELRREELRHAQLEEARQERQARTARARTAEDELVPVVTAALERLRALLTAGLPFRTEERREELARVEGAWRDGLTTPRETLARLFDQLEDELRLSRENSMHTQVVRVGGHEVLAEVIRVGMMMLFFETRDGVLGRAVRENDDWRFVPYEHAEARAQVAHLFESFKRHVRVGPFTLPNALVIAAPAERTL